MIIFVAKGRLGNQIFQYLFLRSVKKANETLIVSGFEDLMEVFEGYEFINLNAKNRWVRRMVNRIMKPVLEFLGRSKIISSVAVDHEKVFENYERESTSVTKRNGLISFITFVELGFFQSEVFFDKSSTATLKIREQFQNTAREFLNSTPEDTYKIFVHMRRGDYKDHTVLGLSALLPMSYYKSLIDYFIEARKNCLFVFLSDDPGFVESEFRYLENKIISHNAHAGTDLAIMSRCHSGILSPSSFCWWGAYLMLQRDEVFAPEYWLGFNFKIEYHKGSTPSFAKVVKV